MTHELVHARRVENLTAALHMLVEAVFWFHPLVWWMERRLTAKYDFTLRWTPDTNQGAGLKLFDDGQSAAGNTLPAENFEPSLFTAIQEQLGLNLQPDKDSVPLLVIDHIERPSAN